MPKSPICPAILYWGTPVVIISTTNADGTSNIAPMSSAFWLRDRCVLGLAASSQTTMNLLRTKQCVLNLPSDDQTEHVNSLALTTGTSDVPLSKQRRGYRFVKDKFAAAGMTPQCSELVNPPRILECPVQMEAELYGTHECMGPGPATGQILALEVRILRTYVDDKLRLKGFENRIDSDKWRPLIMSFQQFYGLRGEKKDESKLATIDEELYRPGNPWKPKE